MQKPRPEVEVQRGEPPVHASRVPEEQHLLHKERHLVGGDNNLRASARLDALVVQDREGAHG